MPDLKKCLPAIDGPFALVFTNPLTVPVVRILARTGISPNLVTLAGFLLALASSFLFLHGSPAAWVAGGLLCQFAFILDGCDGTLARRTGRTSYFGAWLDRFLDTIVDLHFVFTLGIGYALANGLPLPAVKIVVLLAVNVFYWSLWNITTLGAPGLSAPRPGRWETAARGHGLRLVFGRDLYLLVITVGAIAYSFDFIFWTVAVLRTLSLLHCLRRIM